MQPSTSGSSCHRSGATRCGRRSSAGPEREVTSRRCRVRPAGGCSRGSPARSRSAGSRSRGASVHDRGSHRDRCVRGGGRLRAGMSPRLGGGRSGTRCDGRSRVDARSSTASARRAWHVIRDLGCRARSRSDVPNDVSEFSTVIEVGAVRSHRSPARHHRGRSRISIWASTSRRSVATFDGRVVDAFYVRDELGRKRHRAQLAVRGRVGAP